MRLSGNIFCIFCRRMSISLLEPSILKMQQNITYHMYMANEYRGRGRGTLPYRRIWREHAVPVHSGIRRSRTISGLYLDSMRISLDLKRISNGMIYWRTHSMESEWRLGRWGCVCCGNASVRMVPNIELRLTAGGRGVIGLTTWCVLYNWIDWTEREGVKERKRRGFWERER